MTPDEYVAMDATSLAGAVQRGERTAVEVVAAAIERIDALNGRLNAVTETAFGPALEAAARVESRQPLAGVPFLAKDMNIDVAGLRLTASCRWLADLPPATADAPLAERWRRAGLMILGRTNLPEWAEDFITEPTWRGPTVNPWDGARSPGGSSGGAAAAVASGMVPVAHATDSGGSVRVPAAACGLVGLKPSRGLVPVGPHHDELAGGFDCEHVLSRSVRDSALMLDLTVGSEPTSRQPFAARASRYAAGLADPPRPLRVGLVLRSAGGIAPEEEIGAAVEHVARMLARAGHSIRPFEFPRETKIGDAAAVIWMTAIAEEIDHYIARVGREPRADELELVTRECRVAGGRWSAVDYVRARRACTQATRALVHAMCDLDVLLLPTTATLPPLTGAIDGRTGAMSFEAWSAASYRYAPYTELFNATGQPAISLPLGHSRAGLPIGVQFAAALGEDAMLLSLGAWFEREMPWEQRGLALRHRLL
jgi:amidase